MNPAAWSRCARVAIFFASLCGAPRASAQDKPAFRAAAEAYDAGIQAHKQRDYARAARLFAYADELAPDPAAALAALKSVLLADDAMLGMTLAARAERSGIVEGALSDAMKEVRDKFAGRVGRVRIACTGCVASIDGTEALVGQDVFVLRGEHAVELTVGGRVERRSVVVDSSDPVDVSPALPAVALPIPERSQLEPAPPRQGPSGAPDASNAADSGLSPAWFFVGVGVTGVAGGFTIASGVDVRNRERNFVRTPTEQKAANGQAAETRTYVLGAVTGAAGLATAALGIFAVRWKNKRTAMSFRSNGAGFVMRVRAVF